MKKLRLCLIATLWVLLFSLFCFPEANAQLAAGKSKFLGGVFASSAPASFTTYWNQVTPENAGKWGSVEGTRGTMNWTGLDNAYNFAKSHGYVFKQHNFVWGAQYPSWITSLSAADQKAEVEQWISAYGARYPNTDFIDVVNEPIKTACPFKDALGGAGTTGYDWIVWSYQTARKYCPTAKLLINEYGTENDPNARKQYIAIINILKSKGLLDGIGVQAHYFNLDNMSASQMTSCLNDYAATGLPVYISELDIRGSSANEATQLAKYQELFPVMWENANVKGITIWGYIEGQTWQSGTGLLNADGTEKSAMKWLKQYMGTVTTISVTGVTMTPTTATINVGATAQLTATIAPTNATNKNVSWSSSNTSIATVNATGVVTGVAAGNATITVTTQDGAKTATCAVTVTNIVVPVTGVTVSPATTAINVSSTSQLTATIAPANATDKAVSWSSSNTAFATVSATGLVTGVAVGTATITVTTHDGSKTATSAVTVSVISIPPCSFGTPLATTLPTLNKSYNYIYVLGTGGPNLSNVSNLTINWDLPNKGLWQLSMNTKDGKPNWYCDIRTGATQTFASVQPSISLAGTGFTGLDGSYYAAIDNGNFVLVSKTGGFTLYFSSNATAPVCAKSAPSLEEENAFKLFPNPFTGSIRVQIENSEAVKKIDVVDQLGRILIVVEHSSISNEIRIGEGLKAGSYFLRVHTSNEVKSYLIIKK
jgi:endo-1,4-beta-xylanase